MRWKRRRLRIEKKEEEVVVVVVGRSFVSRLYIIAECIKNGREQTGSF